MNDYHAMWAEIIKFLAVYHGETPVADVYTAVDEPLARYSTSLETFQILPPDLSLRPSPETRAEPRESSTARPT